MKLSEASKAAGFSHSYFSVMKRDSPEKFKYLQSIDNNMFVAWNKYLSMTYEIKEQMETMFYELEDNKELYKFSHYLFDLGIYTNKLSFYISAENFIFSSDGIKKHQTIMKCKDILIAYESFKETA